MKPDQPCKNGHPASDRYLTKKGYKRCRGCDKLHVQKERIKRVKKRAEFFQWGHPSEEYMVSPPRRKDHE